jgi:4-amino-4-deoxychorismate lyase
MAAIAALINGRRGHCIDASDRGLLYGDGLFETIAVRDQAACLWSAHLARLTRGAQRLGVPMPDPCILRREAAQLMTGVADGVLRITLTRGVGGRGYRPAPNLQPTRILALYPSPTRAEHWQRTGVHLTLCRTRLSENPQLAGIKHLNRLEQVLARSEWNDANIVDGVMTDSRGLAICGTMTNLFLVDEQGITTPSLSRCGVEGVVRSLVFECAEALGLSLRVTAVTPDALAAARAVFVTNSLLGPLPVARFETSMFDPCAFPEALIEHVRHRAFHPETES